MEKMGYNISGQKCCIKFQAMKRTYKSIKDHNKKSENSARKWEYFDVNISFFLCQYFYTKAGKTDFYITHKKIN